MGRDFEELLGRVAGQLEGLERREHERDRRVEEQGKEIVALKTALGLEGKFGEHVHDEFRERLKEGDGDLRELRDKAKEHSTTIRGIQTSLAQASGRRWDLAQILITAAIGLLCALVSAGVSAALAKTAPPPAPTTTVKGATP